MAENQDLPEEFDEEFEGSSSSEEMDHIIRVSGMYQNWFLDYASYVILERAVPHVNDGLKPVQRRILHSLKELDDGRFHKVANVIGNTMKYHPHGDASIGDALVQLGQKELLFDCQGNWGNIFTGDRAAAARYIEVRLSKFGNEVVFNHKTTVWLSSYDGRGKEPVTLPVKFPLLLAQGVEGIAVGMACKMLPHNFLELIDASIDHLLGKRVNIFPDFPTGGMVDVSNYNNGLRGGKIRVRAKISVEDKKTLRISDIPFGTTTTSLIDSILKANDKGKIKIRKIEDNTAEFVEILVYLKPNVSPDRTIDALYAFTDCESSISPNAAVIENDKPRFLGVNEILKHTADQTQELLKMELEIKKAELLEQLHFASLEKIFIENKIYVEFDGLTYEAAIELTKERLIPFVKNFIREVTHEDVVRLLEIKMRRITKHDSDKANSLIDTLNEEVKKVDYQLDNLIVYAVDYYKRLKEKYGKGKERKTEIKSFESINKSKVAVANEKLYVNYKEGFAGTKLKKTESEFVCDCSDIDDVIVMRKDGMMQVSRVSEKAFFGKDILYIGIWKKGDSRTTYNLVYQDGPRGFAYVKRFAVNSITRDKEYPLSIGNPGSQVLYLTVNPNGEAEVIKIVLRQKPKIKNLKFDFYFAEQTIKGRSAKGNIITKHSILKIELKEAGVSTLGARKIWFDETVQRLNTDERGRLVGAFSGDDKILTVMPNGDYKISEYSLSTKFDDDFVLMERYDTEKPLSVIYYDGDKQQYNVKRFVPDLTDKRTSFITEHPDSFLELVSIHPSPEVVIKFDQRSSKRDDERIKIEEFISVKGMKAQGNRLTSLAIKSIDLIEEAIEGEESTGHVLTKDEKKTNQNTNDDSVVEFEISKSRLAEKPPAPIQTNIETEPDDKKEAVEEPKKEPLEQVEEKPLEKTTNESASESNSSDEAALEEDIPEEVEPIEDKPSEEIEFEIEEPKEEKKVKIETTKLPKDPKKPKDPPSNQITLEL